MEKNIFTRHLPSRLDKFGMPTMGGVSSLLLVLLMAHTGLCFDVFVSTKGRDGGSGSKDDPFL
jgi:hypothetical protein